MIWSRRILMERPSAVVAVRYSPSGRVVRSVGSISPVTISPDRSLHWSTMVVRRIMANSYSLWRAQEMGV